MPSLAESFPQVAATWHPERNGSLTPDRVLPKVSREVWWRCPAGHEWQERIAARTTLPEWKNGDVAACRWCTGWLVSHTYACGHTEERTRRSNLHEMYDRCWQCRQAAQGTPGDWSRAAKAAAPGAAELIAGITVQEGAPDPLVQEWRWWAAKHLQGAAAREAHGKNGAAGQVLSAARAQAGQLLPDKAAAEAAAAHGDVLRVLDQAHWAAGWLHYLTAAPPHPVSGEDLADAAALAGNWLTTWAQSLRAAYGSGLQTRNVTGLLTEGVRRLAASYQARCYRELKLPVVPPGKGRYGRLDIVICQPPSADVVIEIDSAPNPSSAAKLAFARDAGAFPVWIRFGQGGVDAPDGVAVIDLRAATRSLVRQA